MQQKYKGVKRDRDRVRKAESVRKIKIFGQQVGKPEQGQKENERR